MRFFNWLFRRQKSTVTCPRCIVKGHVDEADIVGQPEAIMRSTNYEHNIEEFIQQIRVLHFQQNLTPDQIVQFYIGAGADTNPRRYEEDRKELLGYINSVITRFS